MSEKVWAYCDYCNSDQHQLNLGRGYAEMSEQDAVDYLEWERTDKGVKCLNCLEDEENGLEGR